MRFGTVAIVGRSNVGKSTFLNAAVGERLAIVSHRPQTTRDTLLGVSQRGEAQIAFVDTPGLHRPQSELGRRMNAVAVEAARATDVILFMTDTTLLTRKDAGAAGEDHLLLDALPADASSVLVINKVDLLRDKSKLLPFIERYTSARNFVAVVPVSLLDKDDVERLLLEIIAHLPEGDAGYDDETLTDRPTTFFIREYIREQVLLQIGREVPHAVAVSIDEVDDRGHIWLLKATIHVEKVGQRKILIGSGGRQIRAIGIAARERIEQLIERKVHLELFVRVTPRWKDVTRQLAEFGYESHGTRADLGAPVTRQQKRGGQK